MSAFWIKQVCQRELSVRRHEEATGAPAPDSVKTSMVVMHAPRTIQSYLRVTDANLISQNARS
eukprot:1540769-Heterocapsa_arctica.AAC.1